MQAAGLGQRGIGIWWLFVLAVVLFGESGDWAKWFEEEWVEPSEATAVASSAGDPGEQPKSLPVDLSRDTGVEAQHRNDVMRSLIEVALMVLVALGWWNHAQTVGPAQGDRQFQEEILRRIDHVDDELKRYLDRVAAGPPGVNVPRDLVLQIDSEMRRALLDYLKDRSSPRENIPWMTIALAGGVLVLLAFVIKKHPSAAPLAGAAPLAVVVIEHAEHLSKFCGVEFWGLVVFFGGVAIVLMVSGFFWAQTGNGPVDTGPEGAKNIASPLTMGFSLMILVVAFALVARCPGCSSCVVKPGPEHGTGPGPDGTDGAKASVLSSLSVKQLTPAPLFDAGDWSRASGVVQLDGKLGAIRQKGDKLLLIGSADCTPFSKGNEKLAGDRAEAIKTQLMQLDSSLTDDDFIPEILHEHAKCEKDSALRSVFPFLIHSESKVVDRKTRR